jgi:hypothetical protein
MSERAGSLLGVSAYVDLEFRAGLDTSLRWRYLVSRRTQLNQIGERKTVALQLVALDCCRSSLQVPAL